jgi:hypothetical protein
MSQLAYDEDGQHFQVKETVRRWRIRRFNNPGKPGGAQVVYGDDGLPLFLDVEANPEEFREAVGGVPGRYRFDGVDVHGRLVDGVPPAYLMINGPTTTSGAGYGGAAYSVPPASSATEHALVEIARINGEAFKSVADKFGNICDALSHVVRAVDGAGLPRRAPLGPLLVDHVDQDEDDDNGEDERNAAPPPAPQATWSTMLGQVMQMVQVFTQMNAGNPANFGTVMGQVVETAKVIETVGTTTSAPAAAPATDEPPRAGDVVDMRAASAGMHGATTDAHAAPREATRLRSSANAGRVPVAAPAMAPTSAAAPGAAPAADPMAHFTQIMAGLMPEEQAQVQYVVTKLSMGDLMQWYDQLARMTVAEGVAKIRAELARTPMEQAA